MTAAQGSAARGERVTSSVSDVDDFMRGKYGTEYSINLSDPVTSIDYHLSVLARQPKRGGGMHPDIDRLLDRRLSLGRLWRALKVACDPKETS